MGILPWQTPRQCFRTSLQANGTGGHDSAALPSQQITDGEKAMNSKKRKFSVNGQQQTPLQPNANPQSGDVAERSLHRPRQQRNSPKPQHIIRRENYCKFAQVEQALVGHLEAKTATKDAARELGISVPIQ